MSDLPAEIAEKSRTVRNDAMWSCYVNWPFG